MCLHLHPAPAPAPAPASKVCSPSLLPTRMRLECARAQIQYKYSTFRTTQAARADFVAPGSFFSTMTD